MYTYIYGANRIPCPCGPTQMERAYVKSVSVWYDLCLEPVLARAKYAAVQPQHLTLSRMRTFIFGARSQSSARLRAASSGDTPTSSASNPTSSQSSARLRAASPLERGDTPKERGGTPKERGDAPKERGGTPKERGDTRKSSPSDPTSSPPDDDPSDRPLGLSSPLVPIDSSTWQPSPAGITTPAPTESPAGIAPPAPPEPPAGITTESPAGIAPLCGSSGAAPAAAPPSCSLSQFSRFARERRRGLARGLRSWYPKHAKTGGPVGC